MRVVKLFALSSLAVIVYDAVASIASLALGFPYANSAFGSAVLYVAFAFLCARRFGFRLAVLLGAVMGFVDSTLGWAVSWAIGAGALPSGTLTPLSWLLTAVFVVALGAVYGLVGGSLGVFTRRRREA